jgi:hypothetical protein
MKTESKDDQPPVFTNHCVIPGEENHKVVEIYTKSGGLKAKSEGLQSVDGVKQAIKKALPHAEERLLNKHLTDRISSCRTVRLAVFML